LLAASQTNPPAQSSLVEHWLTHAPNAGSHAKGAQSNAVTLCDGHATPAFAQNAGPTPVDVPVHRGAAHSLPVVAPMHVPSPPHVPMHERAGPHSWRRSMPIGSTVHVPIDEGSAHE
jgi:hypothetical protein